jgi:nicotinate-nucleotide adenylyltransferase
MRIGIYSGSFDPIHCGHAMVANYASQWGGVDEVWLMVSRLNPLKKDGCPPAADAHRLRMAQMVAEECNGVKASDFELELPEPSYTYVTLKKLQERYPEHSFVLIIGSDNWVNLGRWRDAGKIIREFGLLIYPRPGFETPHTPPPGVTVLGDGPTAHISSSFVRQAIGDGANINFFVPVRVAEYITTHNLYEHE